MDYLVLQLIAPLSSWGATAVGEYRGSYEHPGESALVGLLGAALGIRRDDEAAHINLRDFYGFAIGVQSAGKLLRDFHTAQVPGRTSLKGRPHSTRRDELTVRRHELSTILSTRDYRQDAACLVAVQLAEGAPYPLNDLAEALRKPKFTLYLGRKSCPLAEPLFPLVIDADTVIQAFQIYESCLERAKESIGEFAGPTSAAARTTMSRVSWGEGIRTGLTPDLTVTRKDRLIRRRGWQFGDRQEFVKIFEGT